jgi:hypothetical protein
MYFRGTWYRAEHRHKRLVDPDLFEQSPTDPHRPRRGARQTRAQVNSDHTLAGLVTGANCGQRYLGTAATGTEIIRYLRIPTNLDIGSGMRAPILDRYPRQDSNLRSRLRRAVLYPLSYGGVRPQRIPGTVGAH